REFVVLRRYVDVAVAQVLDGVVAAVVPEAEAACRGPGGHADQLVSEADPEHRRAGFDQLADRVGQVRQHGRVTRPVGHDDAVRFQRQYVAGAGQVWHDDELGPSPTQ